MNRELLPYYERELHFVKRMAAEFAEDYPERAAALRIDGTGSEDPHVERILEAFALVAGRIQYKLDEEFPEITNALLELMYPHLLRPVPPMAILQFEVDPILSKQRTGHLVPRGTMAHSAPMDGVQCRFQTAYPVTLWPMEITAASFGKNSDVATRTENDEIRHALRIEFRLLGGNKLSALDLSAVRLRIGGELQAAHWLYELIMTKAKRVVLRSLGDDGEFDREASVTLSAKDCLQPIGFAREEALLPVAETSFQGYRLVQEYFSFPQKFLFFELSGLDRLLRRNTSDRFEVVILIEQIEYSDRILLLESSVNAAVFQLGCTPAINLFQRGAEPIRLSHTKTEYVVVPDVYAPLGYEIYSVDNVIAEGPDIQKLKSYRPFYSFQHGSDGRESEEAFWFCTRGPSTRSKDLESDVFLSFVDRGFNLSKRANESITVKTTCSNRDLASRLKANRWGELDLESGAMVKICIVDGPTKTLRPALGRALQWRLISHLSLNHLSLVEGGVDALREMLRLYSPWTSRANLQQIDGVTSVLSTRKVARINSEHGFVFCPGIVIDAEFDEERFSGNAYLLASILERFFGLYCAVNSFTQLRVRTRQREGVIWQWPIRSGEQVVV